MDILNSDWLIRMLEKSSAHPEARMLNLFDILDDWLKAPKLNSELIQTPPTSQPALAHYLAIQAAKAGAAMPEMLANQLYFMAIAAMHEKTDSNPVECLHHAKQAAQALIIAQTHKQSFQLPKKWVYASAASFLALAMMTGGWYVILRDHATLPTIASYRPIAPVALPDKPLVQTHLAASPEQTAALFARVEQMRKGNCQLIEALQLPDSYKKVYFENVVMGQISTDADEQRLANALLDKVRCNYTPMLMANSKN